MAPPEPIREPERLATRLRGLFKQRDRSPVERRADKAVWLLHTVLAAGVARALGLDRLSAVIVVVAVVVFAQLAVRRLLTRRARASGPPNPFGG